MKKIKLLKSKFWLTSFALTTMGSLVLAACGHTNTTDTTETVKPEDPKPTPPVIPTIPEAKPEQKTVVTNLLASVGFSTYITNKITKNAETFDANVDLVAKVGAINEDTVQGSAAQLGTDKEPASKEAGKPAFAYLNQLKTDLATLTDAKYAEIKTSFETKFATVVQTATKLTAEINLLPKKTAENQLKTKVATLKTAVASYLQATELEDAKAKLSSVLDALTSLETETKTITKKLGDLIKAAFALDAAVTSVESFINTDVAKVVENSSSTYSTTLNNFVNTVRTKVLGEIGKDLWQADAPNSVSAKPSTLLYSIVEQLAAETKAFTNLKQELKALSFSKALALKDAQAINLLALHVDHGIYLDVSRLNAYLVYPDTNVVEILNKKDIDATTSEKTSLETILKGWAKTIEGYKKYLLADGDKVAQLSTDLTDALATDKITDAEKKPITDFQAAFNKLQPKLTAFYQSFLDLTTNTSFVGAAQNLMTAAQDTNTAIGLAQNLGSVLAVVAASQKMKDLAEKLEITLPEKKADQVDQTEAKVVETNAKYAMLVEASSLDPKTKWVVDYIALQTEWNAHTNETDFTKALDTMANHNYTTDGLKAKIEKIYKVTQTTQTVTQSLTLTETVVEEGGDTNTPSSGDGTPPAQPNGTEGVDVVAPAEPEAAPEVKESEPEPEMKEPVKEEEVVAAEEKTETPPSSPTPTYEWSGYLYTNVIASSNQLLQWLMTDAQTKLNPTLKKLIDLAQTQFSPSLGSQTSKIWTQLVEMYNNGQSQK